MRAESSLCLTGTIEVLMGRADKPHLWICGATAGLKAENRAWAERFGQAESNVINEYRSTLVSSVSCLHFLNSRQAGWSIPSTFPMPDWLKTPTRSHPLKGTRAVPPHRCKHLNSVRGRHLHSLNESLGVLSTQRVNSTHRASKQETQNTRLRGRAPRTCTSSLHRLVTNRTQLLLPMRFQLLKPLISTAIDCYSQVTAKRTLPAQISSKGFQAI